MVVKLWNFAEPLLIGLVEFLLSFMKEFCKEHSIGVWGLGFGVWGLGFGVWGLGFLD